MTLEWLLGFDAREPTAGLGDLWPPERRELFLLRADVPIPLSTDTLVWPSAFDTGQGIGRPAAERDRLHLAGRRRPAYVGPNAGLWEDEANLRRHLSGQDVPAQAHVDEILPLRARWAPRLNGAHLFDESDDAMQFRALTDARVAAHAPFSVFGLYLGE